MQITWYGFSCFRISETVNGHEVSVVIDPFEPQDGAKLPRSLTADVVVSSHMHDKHNNIEAVSAPAGSDAPFIIDGPGEFECKDAFVTGVGTYHDEVEGKQKGKNTMFYLTLGDLHIVHLGDLKHPLEEKHLQEFHQVDVLFVPVGGGDVLTGKQAAEVVAQLEPRVIIPMHYRSGSVGASLENVDSFIKAMGGSRPEVLPKLKMSSKDLPQEDARIVLLEPQ